MRIARNLGLVALASLVMAVPASAATRQFEGTITSVNRDAKTFRLNDTERGRVRVKVTSATRFHRIAGFSALKKGMTRIEVTVHRSNGRWVANLVERSGGGGKHGGNDG
jgi:hypothetical protein